MDKSIIRAACLALIVVSAAFLINGWIFSNPGHTLVGWIIYSLVAGGFLLGGHILCLRNSDEDEWTQEWLLAMVGNFGLWLVSLVLCFFGSIFIAHVAQHDAAPFFIAATVGMAIVSLVWLPRRRSGQNVIDCTDGTETELKAAADRHREDLREAAEIASLLNVPVDGENPEGWPANSGGGPETAGVARAKEPPASDSHAAMRDWTRPTQRF
ncbi:MAG: hypothetical protein WCG99_04290 [Candidatus Berkelbacteria bacterium]